MSVLLYAIITLSIQDITPVVFKLSVNHVSLSLYSGNIIILGHTNIIHINNKYFGIPWLQGNKQILKYLLNQLRPMLDIIVVKDGIIISTFE